LRQVLGLGLIAQGAEDEIHQRLLVFLDQFVQTPRGRRASRAASGRHRGRFGRASSLKSTNPGRRDKVSLGLNPRGALKSGKSGRLPAGFGLESF
jgi:hypothetical protein